MTTTAHTQTSGGSRGQVQKQQASNVSKAAPAVSKASQPTKAGEVPANVTPHVSFQACMDVAAQKIDALLRGGVECITYIGSAFLVGYLARADQKVKLSVMRDEFALALGKKGLGGTQTKKYLDYAFKLSGVMFKDCQYGKEVATLIAATTPDKAHDAVKAFLSRHTNGKKTTHGTKLSDAMTKLNILGIFLGMEDDPGEPENLPSGDASGEAAKKAKARKSVAEKINKDPMILRSVEADTLMNTVATSTVISFPVLVTKHVQKFTKVDDIKKELAEIIAAYEARIKALSQDIGKATPAKKSGKATGETVKKAA